VHRLLEQSTTFLRDTWSAERGLFPFSTSLVEGEYVNDYVNPLSLRYTINTLLGLKDAAAHGLADASEVTAMLEAFLEHRIGDVKTAADWGLLLVLLRDELERPAARTALERVDEIARGANRTDLNVQDLAWMLWGSCAAAQAGDGGSRDVALRLYERIVVDHVDARSGLARHSTRAYRSRIVSFGSTVYFLRSMYEYARLAGDEAAGRLFGEGVQRMIGLQGPRGEWPWMFDTRAGTTREIYPVFAVHQDSMAMLFLLPALDGGGPGIRPAIERSIAWGFGDNELEVDMYPTARRFMAYRSIERRDRAPRAARYGRVVLGMLAGRSARPASTSSLRINPECRSYHLGWILYAWSSRQALLKQVLGGSRSAASSRCRPAVGAEQRSGQPGPG
jgi:hypothetical protein